MYYSLGTDDSGVTLNMYVYKLLHYKYFTIIIVEFN